MFIIFRRQLRESANNYVAGNIYINRDLSSIEAKLAYQKQVKRRERLILCQNLRSATSSTPDCELMSSVYTTAVGLNDRADIVHVFTAYCYVPMSCLACQC